MSFQKCIGIAFALCIAAFGASTSTVASAEANLIVHNGKIVTVDPDFSIHEAMAIQGDRILAVGNEQEILKLKGANTEVLDLNGKMVLPGLIDSHVHSASAAMYEFDHTVPDMETIADVLDYIKSRVEALDDGQWIVLQQVFITRLREQRYPTRAELDRVAPKNPVVFRTGPDASLNSLALKLSGIDKDFKVTDGGPGYMEVDPATGEPTGILRGINRYVNLESSGKKPTEADHRSSLVRLMKDYNAVGITGIAERSVSPSILERYEKLRDDGQLTVRVALSYYIDTIGETDEIQEKIRKVAEHPLFKARDPMLRIVGVKTYLDGGMLTGSAYMRKPWGVSKIYSIDDPEYRGVLFIPQEKLTPIARTAIENDLQFTAHSVGDGAVHALLDAYYEISKEIPIRGVHPCISHSNFMSKEAVELAAKLGVAVDIQPAWLYLDTRTLSTQFGYDRLRYFQPLKSIFEAGGIAGGGSDHMQKIGSLRSVNPYNPFLGMWVTVSRKARWYDGQLHPEEALSREEAIRFYTINNAYIVRQEKETGSLEAGKRADFIVIDRDLLTCDADAIRDTKVLRTYLDGKMVYGAERASVLDGVEKSMVVCGYSTSFNWPNLLQAKLDRTTGGKRTYHVLNAAVGGAAIARWINPETGKPLGPYDKMLGRYFRDGGGERGDAPKPTVALCQQSLQWIQRGDGSKTPRPGPVNGADDAIGIKVGADAFGKLAERLYSNGCETVFVATHIYKTGMEPQIGNERYALKALLERNVPYLREGPDVWEPTKFGWPDLFADDKVHPNDEGAALMAQLWFEALLKNDGLPVPDWSRAELKDALGEDLWTKVVPNLPKLK